MCWMYTPPGLQSLPWDYDDGSNALISLINQHMSHGHSGHGQVIQLTTSHRAHSLPHAESAESGMFEPKAVIRAMSDLVL